MSKFKVIIFLFLTTSILKSGQLEFSSTNPEVGTTLNITYKTDVSKGDSNYLIVYRFKTDEKYPVAESYMLNNSTSLDIEENDNFLLFKVMNNNGEVDNNSGKLWELVINFNNKPILNANLNKALSYLGAAGENYNRIPNYEMIKKSLEMELKHYPNNIRAQIALVTLNLDFKQIKFEEYNQKMREVLDTKIDFGNELVVTSVIKALYSISEKEKAEKLNNDFVKYNPKSDLAKDNYLEKLADVNSFDEFIDNITKYLNENSNERDISTVYNSFVFAHSQSKSFMQKLNGNLELIKYKPSYLYNEIALTYLEDEDLSKDYTEKEILDSSFKYIELGLNSIPTLNKFKPIDISNIEWNIFKDKTESDLLLTEYKTNLLKNDSVAAFNSVLLAINKAPYQMNSLLYTEVLELAIQYGSTNQIKEIIKYAYQNNAFDRELEKKILNIISNNDGIEISYLNNLIELNNNQNKKALEQSMSNDVKLSGFVQKLDKKFFDLEKLEGDVKIVSISSTWCDVCTQVYPILNQLNAKYKNDSKVNLIGISIWEDEQGIADLSKLIEEYEIKYPYYIDNTDILPRKLNVFGFPTILIVDQNNMVRYTIRGFNNGEELIKLVDDFVEILK